MNKFQVMALIFIILGFIITVNFGEAAVDFQDWRCGETSCWSVDANTENTAITATYLSILLTLFYFFDGDKLGRKRNIILFILTYLSGLYFTVAFTSVFAFATVILLGTTDAGKNTATLNQHKVVREFIGKGGETASLITRFAQKGEKSQFQGIMGLGILFSLNLSILHTINIIPTDLFRELIPTFDLYGLSFDIQYLFLHISVFITVYQTGIFFKNKIVNNKIFNKIPVLNTINDRFGWIFTLLALYLTTIFFIIIEISLLNFNEYEEIQPFTQGIMLIFWSVAFLINYSSKDKDSKSSDFC